MAIQINKYNNSMIYTIRSPHTDKFYIGSTTQKLCKRFVNHKSCYNAYVNNRRNYVSSYKIIELGDSYIELLEQINCDSKIQLEMREGELIRIHKDLCVNKSIAGRKPNQYYIDNTDMILQQRKKYQIDNADKIKQRDKQYKLDNTDKMKKYDKQYKIDNIDHIKQYQRQYKIDNAESIKQYKKDNVDKINKRRRQNRFDKKTPKISIAKEDYDFLIYCDKLMNIQYSYKKFLII